MLRCGSQQRAAFAMDPSELQAIGDTLMLLVTPGRTPEDLVKVVRKAHPQASKKDIARAAFHAIIANADEDLGKARNLQAFARPREHSSRVNRRLA